MRDNKVKTPNSYTNKNNPGRGFGVLSKEEPPNRDLPALSACAMNARECSMGALGVDDLKKVVLCRLQFFA